jgi:chromosomal replication initiator protein
MQAVLDPQLVFERFVVGAGNRMAAAAARRAAESPGRSYNPLLICGPPGIGKSHLLHAIGHLARSLEPGLHVRYETVDVFVARLSECLAAGDLDRFREENLRIGFLLLDDLQQVAGKPRTQQELLGLCEEMVRWEVQLVAASDRPPHEIPDLREDLRALLAGGLVVDVAPPDAGTRAELLRRWGEESGAPHSDDLLARLSELAVPDARALRSAMNAVLAWTAREGRDPAPEELPAVAGLHPEPETAARDEFGDLVSDVRSAVAAVVESDAWRRAKGGDVGEAGIDPWFQDREKLAWSWIALDERLTEERD